MPKKLKIKLKRKPWKGRSEAELIYLLDICFSLENEEIISKNLNQKNQRLTDRTEFTYRLINHWEKHGLLTSERASDQSWRQYSIMDIIWIYIIADLRSFGFPLEKIKKVKKSLEWLNEKNKYSIFPVLELYATQALLYKTPVFLLVYQDGNTDVVNHREYTKANENHIVDDHIKININQILIKIYPNKDLSPRIDHSYILKPEEIELLWMIRMENYESILIKTNDGKIERFEASQSEDQKSRIYDILKKDNYQNIEIKQRDGKVVYQRRTIIKNFKNNDKKS